MTNLSHSDPLRYFVFPSALRIDVASKAVSPQLSLSKNSSMFFWCSSLNRSLDASPIGIDTLQSLERFIEDFVAMGFLQVLVQLRGLGLDLLLHQRGRPCQVSIVGFLFKRLPPDLGC